jgi:type II secretory pathway component GspD/PulD (secretin)
MLAILKEGEALRAQPRMTVSQGQRITLEVVDWTLLDLSRYLAAQTKMTIIISEQLDDRSVSIRAENLPVETLLSGVARRLGVQLSRVGQVLFLGDLRPEDRGILCRRLTRVSADEFQAVLDSVQSTFGSGVLLPGGVAVIADRVEVLQRIESLLIEIETAVSITWCVQLHVISVSDALSHSLGLDLIPQAELSAAAASVAGSGAGFSATGPAIKASLKATLSAASEGRGASMLSEPMFVLVDGQSGTWTKGQRVPIALKAVSNQGTVNTTSYQYQQTGLTVTVVPRDLGANRCRLSLDLDMKDIIRNVDGAPTTEGDSYQGLADVVCGEPQLIASLKRDEKKNLVSSMLHWMKNSSENVVRVEVWARVYRVAVDPAVPAGGVPLGGAPAITAKGSLLVQAVPVLSLPVPIIPGVINGPTKFAVLSQRNIPASAGGVADGSARGQALGGNGRADGRLESSEAVYQSTQGRGRYPDPGGGNTARY